ncbi:hypothetical protein DFH06DRAFT_1242811 [Mycena polygramma]|nr:hypothetical protein DFH06DRAFT_1242811 [Mycena polygramma]
MSCIYGFPAKNGDIVSYSIDARLVNIRPNSCAVPGMPQVQSSDFLPMATSSTNRSNNSKPTSSWVKLSRWIKGPDLVMDIDVDADAMEEWRKDWDKKWQKYREDFPEESLDHIKGMGQTELRDRGNWLEAEFNRIRESLAGLGKDTADPQIMGGLIFVGELLDQCQVNLVRVLTVARTDIGEPSATSVVPKFAIPMEELKSLETSYLFAVNCTSKMINLKQAQAMKAGNPLSRASPRSGSETYSPRVSTSSSSQNISSEPEDETANEMPTSPGPENIPLGRRTITHGEQSNAVAFQPENIGPGRLFGPRIGQPQLNPLTTISSSSSHMKNLTALLGIAFFGASITWSTVFSGTRGDLVLISWSACLFIVGAVGAAAASMLVLPEEDLVAKHLTVRWTVRVLSLLAMAHVLVGMFLVTLAILVLDPAQGNPTAGAGRRGVRSAGIYSIATSVVFVGVSGAVWRRYTIHTWFRH